MAILRVDIIQWITHYHERKNGIVSPLREDDEPILQKEMKMRLIAIICFVGIILCCLDSLAEQTLKISYVDVQTVFESYYEAKGGAMKTEKEKSEGEHARRDEEIRKLSKELQEKASSLTQEEKEKRRQEIQEKIEGLVKLERAQRQKEQEYLKNTLIEIYEVVDRIGENEGFDLIIEKRSVFGKSIVLYGKKSLDLTDKVVERLLGS